MSEATKTLKIFEPLKTYFELLCTAKPDLKCTDYDDCKELMDILTREDCDPNGKFTKNFLGALSCFAKNLKEADTPIGHYTIKNILKKMFEQAKEDGVKNVDLVEHIVKDVEKSKHLSGFKMSDDNGEGKTYEEILKNVIEENPDIETENIFSEWINKSFGPYEKNFKYFEDEIKNIILSDKFDPCQKNILDKYFNIYSRDGTLFSINDYIKDEALHTHLDLDARLNAKTNEDKTEALIVRILPKDVRKVFNDYLVSSPTEGEPVFYEDRGCVKVKMVDDAPETEFKPADKNAILKWFGTFGSELVKPTRPKFPEEINAPDAKDDEPYYDSDAEITPYSWPDDFQIVNFTDKWRLDKNGKIWKFDDETKKFKEYTDEDNKEDSKKFGDKEGHCGNLCIFENPEECNKFFSDMMKGDSYNIDKLSETINRGDFVRSYRALKENIVKVNPLFVLGTLKLFGFRRFNTIDADGNKIVKIESFTNWWNRQNKDHNLSDKLNEGKLGPYNQTVGVFPGSHEGLVPPAPANLELFFKLLTAFINNNEFILNPKDKKLINKFGKPIMKSYGPSKPKVMYNGKEIDNVLYKSESDDYVRPRSLAELAEVTRKNSLYGARTMKLNTRESILNLPTLMNLMVGITNGGKIKFSKSPLSSTGMGYVNIFGGYGDNDSGESKGLLQCTRNATEIYKIGIESMNKKNKKISPELSDEIEKKIKELSELEQTVYSQLKVLSQYVKVINVLDDKKDEVINSDLMKEAIEKYTKASEKLSQKSDSTISSLLKNLFNEKNFGPTSYFSPL